MKKYNKGQVTVIVPVYNAEKTIKKCIDSVINQTYSNWELMLVDDGSTDNSKNIINEYSKKSEKINVFTQKNLGVSSARNVGLYNANGEYIAFLDSDDCLNKNALETMVNAMTNNDVDMVVGSYSQVKNSGSKKDSIYENKHINLKEDLLNMSMLRFYIICWGKLYKREIIDKNKLSFNLAFPSGQDTIFVFEYLKYVDKVIGLNDILYNALIFKKDISKRNNKTIVKKQYLIYKEYKNLMECKGVINDKRVEKFLISRIKICINNSIQIKMKYNDLRDVFIQIISLREFKDLDKVIDDKYDYTIYKLLKNKHFHLLIMFIKLKNFIRKWIGEKKSEK